MMEMKSASEGYLLGLGLSDVSETPSSNRIQTTELNFK